jgi:hypothetical protein
MVRARRASTFRCSIAVFVRTKTGARTLKLRWICTLRLRLMETLDDWSDQRHYLRLRIGAVARDRCRCAVSARSVAGSAAVSALRPDIDRARHRASGRRLQRILDGPGAARAVPWRLRSRCKMPCLHLYAPRLSRPASDLPAQIGGAGARDRHVLHFGKAVNGLVLPTYLPIVERGRERCRGVPQQR